MSPRSSASPSSPERASEGAPFAKVKQRLLKALRAHGFVKIYIDYDGEGDQGQIESISTEGANRQPVSLEARTRVVLSTCDAPSTFRSFAEVLDEFAWMILAHYHDGFENNDGGFGTITIDVRSATITLDHNDRVVDCSNTRTEV